MGEVPLYRISLGAGDSRGRPNSTVQGYLAHKNMPTPLGPP